MQTTIPRKRNQNQNCNIVSSELRAGIFGLTGSKGGTCDGSLACGGGTLPTELAFFEVGDFGGIFIPLRAFSIIPSQ